MGGGCPIGLRGQALPGPAWVWATSLNPTALGSTLAATALARDPAGNLYVTGSFTGTVALGPLRLRTPARAGEAAAFVAKLTPAGRWLWARALASGERARSGGESVAIDPHGSLYLTGYFRGRLAFPGAASPGLDAGEGEAASHYFVARLDTAGRWHWAQELAVTPAADREDWSLGASEPTSRVVADAAGNAYLNGGPTAAGPVPLAGQLAPTGHWRWTVPAPPGPRPWVTALAVGPAGQLVLAGTRAAPSDAARSRTPTGGGNRPVPAAWLWVARLTPAGRWQGVATARPGGGPVVCTALAVGPTGEAWVAGSYRRTLRFARAGAAPVVLQGPAQPDQLFVARLGAAGHWQGAVAVRTPDGEANRFRHDFASVTRLVPGAAGAMGVLGFARGQASLATRPRPTTLAPGAAGAPFLAWLGPAGQWLGAVLPTVAARPGPAGGAVVVDAVGDATGLLYVLHEGGRVSRGDPRQPARWVRVAEPDRRGYSTVQAICRDERGRVSVAGRFRGALPAPGRPLPGQERGDLLVGQLDAGGAWRWRQAEGFPAEAHVHGLAADSSGRLYVLGTYPSGGTVALDSGRAGARLRNRPLHAGDSPPDKSWFVGQLSPNGGWRWARWLGAALALEDTNASLAVDPTGNAWVAGCFADSLSGYAGTLTVQRFAPTGQRLWNRTFAAGYPLETRLVYSRAGGLYFSGMFRDSLAVRLRVGAARLRFRPSDAGEDVLVRLDREGAARWVLPLGPGFRVSALATGLRGTLWVAGALSTAPARFATRPRATVLHAPDSGFAAAVGLLAPEGTWRRVQPVPGGADVRALSPDSVGGVHVVGTVFDHFAPIPRPAEPVVAGSVGLFMAQLTVTGTWRAVQTKPLGPLDPYRLAVAAGPGPSLAVGGDFTDPLRLDTLCLVGAAQGEESAVDSDVNGTGFVALLRESAGAAGAPRRPPALLGLRGWWRRVGWWGRRGRRERAPGH